MICSPRQIASLLLVACVFVCSGAPLLAQTPAPEPAAQTPATPAIPGAPSTTPTPAANPAPTSIQRNQVPPPAQAGLEVARDEDGRLRFGFRGQPWPAVLEWLAEVSQQTLDWQELPADYLNLETQRSYTLDEARDLINMHLLARGYTLLRRGEVLSVVKLEGINPALVPHVAPEELDQRDPHEWVRTRFPLERLVAEAASEQLRPLVSAFGALTPLKATNQLEAMDAVVNLRELRKLLAHEQNGAQERMVLEFRLQHARATDVAEKLRDLVGVEPQRGRQGRTELAIEETRMKTELFKQLGKDAQQLTKQPPQVRIVANEQDNSVLANAPPDQMVLIKQAVEALDQPPRETLSPLASAARMRTYRLPEIAPQRVASLLEQLRSNGKLDASTRLEADENNRTLIAYAPPNDQLLIASLVQQLDTGGRRFEVIRTGAIPADEIAGTIEYIFGRSGSARTNNRGDRFCVEADVARNQIVVCGTEDELAQVRELTAKLGLEADEAKRPPLVRVLDTRGKRPAELLEQLQRLWPTEGNNPLEIVPPGAAPPASAPAATGRTAPQSKAATVEPPHDRAPMALEQESPLRRDPFILVKQPLSVALAAVVAAAEQPEAAKDALPSPVQEGDSPSQRPTGTAAPVRVAPGPDGRLIVTSPDPEALDRFDQLLAGLLPKGEDFRVFQLEHANAFLVRMNLEDVFGAEDDSGRRRRDDEDRPRLSERQPLRFISDSDTNTVLVQHATPEQLEQIAGLVETYDRPERVDPQTTRVTQIVALKHGQAAELASMVKEVYRDLLSDNDRALGQNQSQEQRRSSYGSRSKRPQFKGSLSLGIDESANQLIVSAPQILLPDVIHMIEQLDASSATRKVSVVALKGGVDALELEATLARVLRPAASSGQQNNAQSGRQRMSRSSSRRREATMAGQR
ncbi:MAG: secretin N-terminal domain-containing protein [Pirellulales bacterium]